MHLPENLNYIKESDFQALIDIKAKENVRLDFKKGFSNLAKDDNKDEFVADVVSFANALGGDIIYGIAEDGNATAKELVALQVNPDALERQLRETVNSRADPRVTGLQVKACPFKDGHLVVVRISKSIDAPHRVKSTHKFFLREGAQKIEMDARQVANLAVGISSTETNISDFRLKRLSILTHNQGPYAHAEGPLLALHLIPICALYNKISAPPKDFTNYHGIPMFSQAGGESTISVDGVTLRETSYDSATASFATMFTNGYFEAAQVLTPERYSGSKPCLGSIWLSTRVQYLVTWMRNYLQKRGLPADMYCLLSLTSAKEATFATKDHIFGLRQFDRAEYFFDKIILTSDENLNEGLKPMLDQVWQAAGFQEAF